MGEPSSPPLSRERIAEVALDIGFDRLTMTAVAKRLGVTVPALYYHVRDLTGLINAAADRALAQLPPPIENPADIGELVRSEALVALGLMIDRPGIADSVRTLPRRPAQLSVRLDALTDRLDELGFDGDIVPIVIELTYMAAADTPFDASREDPAAVEARFHRKLDVLIAGLTSQLATTPSTTAT